ncbi:spore coat protein GerQ [Desmospora profundinema]|uniref:Spore coat protein GerQ n=1 Tax=Desmospora profundinema TaxID=1571184 RepID=A0ABU1IS57_9BACL|nr:spore coat protein GerQ [Desmospora profundinema]MDR6227392.1 spore coat protein GerQ [Desmospora profundinema]
MYWNQAYPAQVADYGWVSQQRRPERVFSEDLLQRNIGRLVTLYLTFENNPQWTAKKVTGTLREVGRDFTLVRDQQTGKDMMFHNINIDFVVFETEPAQLVRGKE